MKMLIFLGTLLLGGAGGWLLKSGPEQTSPKYFVQVRQLPVQQEQEKREVARVEGPHVLDKATGDNLLFGKAYKSDIWICSIRPDGSFGDKQLFIKAAESPPVSGNYSLASYAFLNRPDLREKMVIQFSPMMQGCVSTMIHMKGTGQLLQMNVWTQEKERVIQVREEQFPESIEDAWKLASARLTEASVRITQR